MIIATVMSVILAITGLCLLQIHAKTPGARSQQLQSWPPGSTIRPSETQPTLVVFFHPQCPCSLSTFTELQKLLPKIQTRVQIVAVLVVPPGLADAWVNSRLSKLIAGTPNLLVIVDTDAQEAKLFGIRTSGHAILFDRHRGLQFSGGLTASRGHEGDNIGCAAIDRLINDPVYACWLRSPVETSIFGCPVTSCTKTNCSEKQCR